ncbi:uncharacterized protein LOC110066886 [Orbicella faveolata]|uniref:uncharacterized protein LOC110066886 n=1 Tax=Orbicella faveolata TaxID=48498 RepID=UPI0009E1CAD2|nr:uncharacterized protein LOC110066886 [Orbicella faveolata]
MKVICAGLSKTGTKSIAKALRVLGFSVFDFLEHVNIHHDEWVAIYRRGKTPDFLSMYKDVDAVTDLPAAIWYDEIHQTFPDAKVILSVRDNEDVWLKSWVAQLALLRGGGFFGRMILRYIIPFTQGLDVPFFDDIDMAAYGTLRPESTVLYKKKYREHNERVQAVIPKEKLLIFNVKQGWKPLCEFLGCEIPDQEFPRQNVKGEAAKLGNAMMTDAMRKLFVIFAVFVFLISVFCVIFF